MVRFNMSPIANVTTPILATQETRKKLEDEESKPVIKKLNLRQSAALQWEQRKEIRRAEQAERRRVALQDPMAVLVGLHVLKKPKHLKTDEEIQRWVDAILEKKARRKAKRQRATSRRNARKQPGYVKPPHDDRFSLFYQEYIRSSKWRDKRMEAFEIHGRQCVRCGGFKRLQCHHLTYQRLGTEDAKTDLEILCRDCHEAEHGRKFGCRTESKEAFNERQ